MPKGKTERYGILKALFLERRSMHFGKISAIALSALLLSGCSLNLPIAGTASATGSIWKSFDSGATFLPKVTVDAERKISSADVLTLIIDPRHSETIYIGTIASGLFKTTDGGERWEPLVFPPLKNYGLAFGRDSSDQIYASGVYNNIAKMYRSDDAGKNWREIYTEPGKGTVITALQASPDISDVLYAGTSTGVIIKSTNGGATWDNIGVAKGPVTKILFEKGAPEKIALLVLEKGVDISMDGGKTWNVEAEEGRASGAPRENSYEKQNAGSAPSKSAFSQKPEGMTALAGDVARPGTLYAGAKNGIFRSRDSGKTWEALDIIESSKKFPVRALAVNPANANEIVYASGNAFYRSVDGGVKWSTTQLEINRTVNVIEYDPIRPEILYFALRKF